MVDWLPWLPAAAATLHILEEFVLPGGFPSWYRCYRTDSSRVTPRFLVIVNAALLLACANVGMLGRTPIGAAYWLTISALLFSNGCWHARASYASRSYSPGTVTGMLVYVPLALYGYITFLHRGNVSAGTALAAAVIGGSYPFWSRMYHRARSRSGSIPAAAPASAAEESVPPSRSSRPTNGDR